MLLRVLVDLPRWLLLAMLVFAPWAYGCTRPWGLAILRPTMLITVALWIVGCVVRRQWPKVQPVVLVGAGFLLLPGWWMIVNAQYRYYWDEGKFVPIPCISTIAPGAVDTKFAVPMMVRITGLLGILFCVCDLSQRPVWRRRILWTVGATGITLIIYGLIRRIIGAPEMTATGDLIWTFFANYIYHANAGA